MAESLFSKVVYYNFITTLKLLLPLSVLKHFSLKTNKQIKETYLTFKLSHEEKLWRKENNKSSHRHTKRSYEIKPCQNLFV